VPTTAKLPTSSFTEVLVLSQLRCQRQKPSAVGLVRLDIPPTEPTSSSAAEQFVQPRWTALRRSSSLDYAVRRPLECPAHEGAGGHVTSGHSRSGHPALTHDDLLFLDFEASAFHRSEGLVLRHLAIAPLLLATEGLVAIGKKAYKPMLP
jgi:hypothetical protein